MPVKSRMETWTPLLIVSMPLMIGLLDLLLYKLGGNDATISWVMLVTASRDPFVALSTAYSFAVLMGHCFFPKIGEVPPAAYVVVARMLVVLSPTLYLMVIIAFGGGQGTDEARGLLQRGGSWAFAGWMLLAAIAGGIAGHVGLPQHVGTLPLPAPPLQVAQ